jgi:alkanesulfonate monooxygenase SsuD/methylene tetrahydromethanopterin reductase-like flavin-dependent oxidoreductase (luciferase family)
VTFGGEEFRVRSTGRVMPPDQPIPLLVAALGPRLLRVAGALADGTVLWMANARAIQEHVGPHLRAAAAAAGRPAPRIVAGLPVAVVDDEAEGRRVAAEQFVG